MAGSETSGAVYAGIPATDRRAQRRGRLLDAGLELLGTKGWQATTVRGVCQEASLNPRYFYESFNCLDELAIAIFDRLRTEAEEQVQRAIAIAGNEPERATRAAVSTFVHLMTDDPRKGRVAFIEAMGNPALSRRRLDTLYQFAELVAAYARQAFRATPDQEDAVQLTAQMLVGGMAEVLIAWLDDRVEVSRERLIDHATALFLAAPGAARSAHHQAKGLPPASSS